MNAAGRGFRARLLAVHDRLTTTEFIVAGGAFTFLLGSYLFEVASRYGFDAPTRWSSDMVQYMLCLCIAFALPMVTRDGGHVAITSFLEKLPRARQELAARAIAWLGVLVLGFTTVLFSQVALDQARQGIETVASFAIPKWWLTGVVALGLLDCTLHLLRQGLGWETARAGQELDV